MLLLLKIQENEFSNVVLKVILVNLNISQFPKDFRKFFQGYFSRQ